MRELKDHIVEGDPAPQLKIEVTDEPGAGGASHDYLISAPPGSPIGLVHILFQNGPIKETGVNGITNEALLAIVIDRLRSFQAGSFACDENHEALVLCELALQTLQMRTRDRLRRGVEGETKA